MTPYEKFNNWMKESGKLAEQQGIEITFTTMAKSFGYEWDTVPVVFVTDKVTGESVTIDGSTTFAIKG